MTEKLLMCDSKYADAMAELVEMLDGGKLVKILESKNAEKCLEILNKYETVYDSFQAVMAARREDPEFELTPEVLVKEKLVVKSHLNAIKIHKNIMGLLAKSNPSN